MAKGPASTAALADGTVCLDALLSALAAEIALLAEHCGTLQGSISALLGTVNHPDLGAEIHMLQDVDRFQQTLVDLAAILSAVRTPSAAAVSKDQVGAVIRLESLRQRLGLSDDLPGEPGPSTGSDVTWL